MLKGTQNYIHKINKIYWVENRSNTLKKNWMEMRKRTQSQKFFVFEYSCVLDSKFFLIPTAVFPIKPKTDAKKWKTRSSGVYENLRQNRFNHFGALNTVVVVEWVESSIQTLQRLLHILRFDRCCARLFSPLCVSPFQQRQHQTTTALLRNSPTQNIQSTRSNNLCANDCEGSFLQRKIG